jgi:hypothetical protein
MCGVELGEFYVIQAMRHSPSHRLSLAVGTAVFAITAAIARAHSDDPGDNPPGFFEPIAYGQPESRVSIREEGEKRIIESNDIPNHETGRFPNPGNPNVIRAQSYHYEMPLHPKEAPAPIPAGHMVFGLALNGVKFDPATGEFWRRDFRSIWNEEAFYKGRGQLGMDWSNAHVQPSGAYHYHGIPVGLIKQLHGENKMMLVGWAADGFPIYGPLAFKDAKDATSPLVKMKTSYRLKSGNRPGGESGPGGPYDGKYTPDYEYVADSGDLDECNGRQGVTPEFPEGTYYYVTTTEFPFLGRKFRGTPDFSFRERPPGPGGPGGPGRFGPPPGFPPPPPI